MFYILHLTPRNPRSFRHNSSIMPHINRIYSWKSSYRSFAVNYKISKVSIWILTRIQVYPPVPRSYTQLQFVSLAFHRENSQGETPHCATHAAFNRIYGATYHKWCINDNEISVASRLLTNSAPFMGLISVPYLRWRVYRHDEPFNLFNVHVETIERSLARDNTKCDDDEIMWNARSGKNFENCSSLSNYFAYFCGR